LGGKYDYHTFYLTIKFVLFYSLLCLFSSGIYGQNQKLADSFELVYSNHNYRNEDKLLILKWLAINHKDPEKSLAYSLELIKAAQDSDSLDYIFAGFQQKGNILWLKSDLSNALESFFQAAKIAAKQKSPTRIATIDVAIADVYSVMDNHTNAVKYYLSAIEILRSQVGKKDSDFLASALLNAGDEYSNVGQLDSALAFTLEAQTIYTKTNNTLGLAYSLGNIGMIYAKSGNSTEAERNMNKVIFLMQEVNEYYPICIYLTYMSDIYLEKENIKKALAYAQRSLALAKQYGLKDQISDANLKLSELYDRLGDPAKSLPYYKAHITYRDSVSNIKSVEQIADLRTDFEVSKKQTELDLLHQQKRNQQIIVIATSIALVLIFLLALGLFRQNTFIKKNNHIIQEEKNRSDALLLNILPEETAQELKQNGKVRAQRFESVTVLFTDFIGFTQYAENLTPEKVVEIVDFYFSKFDSIIEKYDLEKIKTVGDSYMCAGGLPFPTENHAFKMVQAAFEIAEFVNDVKEINPENEVRFDIRIGINTGPVVAGIVGTKKFVYDIWGDTVNIASRMESKSEPGRVNVSKNTYEIIKDTFNCEYRGEVEVKNKGVMQMYFVDKIKETSNSLI
jgi:adenylate cyclase